MEPNPRNGNPFSPDTSDYDPTAGQMKPDQMWADLFWAGDQREKPAKLAMFAQAQGIPLQPTVEPAIKNALSVFYSEDKDEYDKDINPQVLTPLLAATAKVESRGGHPNWLIQRSDKTSTGTGPARGIWQVEPATARSITKTSGLIGPQALKLLGKTKKQLVELDDAGRQDLLLDHDNNAVFAIAKYLQAADTKDSLHFLQKKKPSSKNLYDPGA